MLTTSNVESIQTDIDEGFSSGAQTAIEERRCAERLRQEVAITLTPMGHECGIGCHAEDISAGGVFVHLPIELKLEVGRRVEVSVGETDSSRNTGRFEGETCFATVIRTEQRGPGAEHVVGAGLRFDHPLFVDPATLQ
jgi:hypothetical protein